MLTFADKPVIKVLTGIRRCGKSSLLRLVADRLVGQGVDPRRLVLSEYLPFRERTKESARPLTPALVFQEFRQTGGFPGLHRLDFTPESIRQYLSAALDSVVLKDVVMRHQVRDVHLLRKLLVYVADNYPKFVLTMDALPDGSADESSPLHRTAGQPTNKVFLGKEKEHN